MVQFWTYAEAMRDAGDTGETVQEDWLTYAERLEQYLEVKQILPEKNL